MTAPRHGAEGGEKGAALTEERDDEHYVTCRHCGVGIWYLCDNIDAALRARVAELERVIEWALGERGDFPSLPDDWPKRKFYWRTELRERAFGKSKAKVSG